MNKVSVVKSVDPTKVSILVMEAGALFTNDFGDICIRSKDGYTNLHSGQSYTEDEIRYVGCTTHATPLHAGTVVQLEVT
jgi:hypothetical protein